MINYEQIKRHVETGVYQGQFCSDCPAGGKMFGIPCGTKKASEGRGNGCGNGTRHRVIRILQEWLGEHKPVEEPTSAWQAALAWAESSGRYIRVPEKWPDELGGRTIAGIVVRYTGHDSQESYEAHKGNYHPECRIAYIPRPTPPKPVWEPKVGEVVLWRFESRTAWCAGKVQEKETDWSYEIKGQGIILTVNISPFDPAKIGEVE